jgi:hypothetical protein
MDSDNFKPEDVFHVCNKAVLDAATREFGPPGKCKDPKITAKLAVSLMQLSLRYFADTGAPREVVADFFNRLVGGEEKKEKPRIERDGNRLILPGQVFKK